MTKVDIAMLWAISGLAGLAAVVGKVGLAWYGLAGDPPTDPAALNHWERRRRWLAYSELSALPAFATTGVAATVYFDLPPVASVLISMALGALGFGAVINGVQLIVRRRLGIEQ